SLSLSFNCLSDLFLHLISSFFLFSLFFLLSSLLILSGGRHALGRVSSRRHGRQEAAKREQEATSAGEKALSHELGGLALSPDQHAVPRRRHGLETERRLRKVHSLFQSEILMFYCSYSCS